jgi:antitoxin Phd
MAEPLRASATEFKQSVGKYLDATRTGRVIIERQGRPTAVLLSFEEYERLDPGAGRLLDLLSGQFESLVAEMQTEGYQASMESAFEAPAEELGAAYQRGRRRRGGR